MDLTIPQHTDETVRMACLEAATALNCMREEPRDAAGVLDDATLFEHYVSNGQSIAVFCAQRLERTFRD